ncbi:MAG: hypothetical protein ACREXU_08165 [Gammaproteobacteria bacterium]
MDPWFGIFLYVCHAAIVAYFLFLTNTEAREQERRREARRRRIELLGFRPRAPRRPPEEMEFLA